VGRAKIARVEVRDTEEVLAALDAIVEDAIQRPSRLGLFAAMYRHVTAQVRAGIHEGRFDDGERMERFDAIFANRYLAAYRAWHAGEPCSRSWRVAFAAADEPSLICLQHLLLGMNAHINLDLGIAAAEVCPGPRLPELQRDFEAINDILLALLDRVQAAIGGLSPLLHVLDGLVGGADELLASFSMVEARRQAWRSACLLAALPESARPTMIAALDHHTALLARLLIRTDPLTSSALALIRRREPDDVATLVRAMQQAL
jgi:hypothetical protein